MLKIVSFIVLNVVLIGCAAAADYSSSPNFNPSTGQFEHPNYERSDRSFFGLLLEFWGREKDDFEDTGFPVTYSTKAELSTFSESMIWVGQSTVLLNHNDITILTDPHFTGRASPFSFVGPKRITPPPFEVSDLPKVDIVLISHNHYDHLDKKTIIALSEQQPDIKYFVPLGLAETLTSWGAQDVVELDWWQLVTHETLEIHATPLQHWSSRGMFDRNKTLWSGWMVKWDDFSFYFAGDAGYSNDFKETAQRLGSPTLAAIPIGAYEPRDFMKASHMNPEEAVKAFQDLGADHAFGIHWGTFKLTLEKLNEPPMRLKKALEQNRLNPNVFRSLQHGEAWSKALSGNKRDRPMAARTGQELRRN